jgi:RNAse (barnase) inhibitor barstar
VNIIELDAKEWKTVHDFYDALLAALGAPEWHGDNVNALNDSIIGGASTK